MNTSNKFYTLKEFETIFRGKSHEDHHQSLDEDVFDKLERFILENNSDAKYGSTDFFRIGSKRGIKTITAGNYVGVMAFKDGTVIEILPKIYSASDTTPDETKLILLNMLRTLKDITYVEFTQTGLRTERVPIFDIFVTMFLQEVITLTKQGLRSSYQTIESSQSIIKGKIHHTKNIKENLIHKEKFSLLYDEFNLNRAENRLIKTTLKYLQSITRNHINSQSIRNLLNIFSEVTTSENIYADLNMCQIDRNITHYRKTINWCKIFLLGNSFTSYSGNQVAMALLFPMEKVFEQFVATKVLNHFCNDYKVYIQHNQFSLFDEPQKQFSLRPDIYLEDNKGKKIIVDSKWKILSNQKRNYGISQSDMYQVYAYSKKYEADRVVLVYPYVQEFIRNIPTFSSNDGVKVDIRFLDLKNTDASSIRKILEES